MQVNCSLLKYQELSLKSLRDALKLGPQSGWIDATNTDYISVCKLVDLNDTTIITHSLIVKEDFSWTLTIHGTQVDIRNCSCLSGIPEKLDLETLPLLLSIIDASSVCCGNFDDTYVRMMESKSESPNKTSISAFIDCHALSNYC